MSNTPRRVCIVAPSYLCSTPRVVKEATALADAGFDVRVVFGQEGSLQQREFDEVILAGNRWRATVVRVSGEGERLQWLFATARQRFCRSVPSASWRFSTVAEAAQLRLYPELARAAASEPADLYIGHYPAGLAAAARAATHWGARLGFDAEDFHGDEGNSATEEARARFIERRYLTRCDHLTASSTGIAAAIASEYGVSVSAVVHNVFPWSNRERLDGQTRDRCGDALSLYWYSQTIGLDRGLQEVIRAAGYVRAPLQIHFRGRLSSEIRRHLEAEAAASGVLQQLHFHDQVPPEELLSRAVEHDIGLALEQPFPLNKSICASNKLFFYMLAGLAIAATDVPGQHAVIGQTPNGARLYPPNDVEALARVLREWQSDRDALGNAKRAALEAARSRWNWEKESRYLIDAVEEAMRRAPKALERGLRNARPTASRHHDRHASSARIDGSNA
jgi:glycosyltransferase involved in cell wall biosynthesis